MNAFLKELINQSDQIKEIQKDTIIFRFILSNDNILILNDFYESDYIESIRNEKNGIIAIEQLNEYHNQTIFVEFVIAELRKEGFYVNLNDFIICNRFAIPEVFYILEIKYSCDSLSANEDIEKYKAITHLINILINKAKFIADDDLKTLYLIHENTFLELPIDIYAYEDVINISDLNLIKEYIENIQSFKEKRSIYIKELIDFLTSVNHKDRFKYLLNNFKSFYERCNTSYEYYLANFSFNKIKLELDNAILEYSKNIRAIINDSQTKLIAIPAAFILTATQIDFDDVFCLKNIIVIISSFLFSYIISIFIKNQKSALNIINDNVNNYKNTYKHSKENIFETEKDLNTLTYLINESYFKTEEELKKQNQRLSVLQFCCWGISVSLLITLIIIKFLP